MKEEEEDGRLDGYQCKSPSSSSPSHDNGATNWLAQRLQTAAEPLAWANTSRPIPRRPCPLTRLGISIGAAVAS